ncbi:lysostaphin resistance A-like protein [Nocardia sp. NPDC052566]|uniref:lysostaphin resistance A-like protein n=1 Tax=Nocardia sp. NPDC052566 TaxID=3364330 RepID=UPI0037CCA0D1
MSVGKSAAAAGVALLWSNWALPRLGLDLRGRTAANTAFATGYAVTFGGEPHWFSARGLRYGLLSASLVTAGYAAALSIPPLRKLLAVEARETEVSNLEWAAVHIPLGTVYTEELIFRATLDPLLDNTFGPRPGTLLGALTFGLWHIHPARSAGDNAPLAVLATALGSLPLGWLRRHTTSTTAPSLLHLAINTGGVLASHAAEQPHAL